MINKLSAVSFGSAKIFTQLPKKARKLEEEKLPDFFRDGELFDSKKDAVTDDYFTYSSTDIPANKLYHTEEDVPYDEVVDTYRNNLENGFKYRDISSDYAED